MISYLLREIYLIDESRFLTEGNKKSGQFFVSQKGAFGTAINAPAPPPPHNYHQEMEESRTPLNMKPDVCASEQFVGVGCDVVELFQ